MKIASSTAVTSTFTSTDAVECAFDPAGTAHLMGILSNMYRDAPMAVLREYTANARDSHIQAGNPAPVGVTLPTEWAPTLTVTDQGVGLSQDELLAVYAIYGKSTKRDTDDQVGAFGIGAKAAFTVSTQFTVIGVKDGKRTVALFALNADGVGTVDIKAHDTTDQPNGVTVTIPVDNPVAVRHAADRLFSTWPPGSVLVDGAPPDYALDTMLRVTDTVYARYDDSPAARQGTSADAPIAVVMGGITYPASTPMLKQVAQRAAGSTSSVGRLTRLVSDMTDRRTGIRLLVTLPVGSVDITPSREDLRDTPRTIAALAKALRDYTDLLPAALDRELAAEPTATHAAMRAKDLMAFATSAYVWMRGSAVHLSWRGHRLGTSVAVPSPTILLEQGGSKPRTKYDDHGTLTLGTDLSRMMVVTGVDTDSERTVRRLANRFMTHHTLHTLVLAPDSRASIGWFAYGDGTSPVRTLTFEQFKVKASALPGVSQRRDTSYLVATKNGDRRTMPCAEIRERRSAGSRLLLAGPAASANLDLAGEALDSTDLLVVLTGTQTEQAFLRRFPATDPADPLVLDHARRTLGVITTDERLAVDHTDSWALDHPDTLGELESLHPLTVAIEQQHQRRAAAGRIPGQRLNYLKRLQRLVTTSSGSTESRVPAMTGLPLIDLLLHHVEATRNSQVIDDVALREHLALYLDAARAHDLQPNAA